MSTETEFEKSIVYEAFVEVYVGDTVLNLQEDG